MSAEWDVLATRIVIETGVNDKIAFATNGGALAAVTIPPATYYVIGDGSASDIIAAVETACNAVGPDIAIDVVHRVGAGERGVSVEISLVTATDFRFDPFDALNTFPLGVLGIYSNTGFQTSTEYTSGYSWVSNQPVFLEDAASKRRRANQMITKGGDVYTFVSGPRITRRLFRFDHVEPARTWATSSPSDPGRSFDRFSQSIDGGERFYHYRATESSPGILRTPGVSDLRATYVADLAGGWVFEPRRIAAGGPLFAFEFEAIEVVT